jgi:hypothetical protein
MRLPFFMLDYLSIEVFRSFPELPLHIFTFILMIFPTIGYVDKLRKMIKASSPEFFDMNTALILLVSNHLRFLYWMFEPYQVYLLGQAIAVFLMQILLAIFAFYYQNVRRGRTGSISNRFLENRLHYYVQIRKVVSAVDFLISVICYGSAMFATFMLSTAVFGVERVCTSVILVANILDTFVSIPQFVTIVINRNIAAASSVLLVQYISGGWFKLVMYLASGIAWPFVFGALLQVSLDLIVAVSFIIQAQQTASEMRYTRAVNLERQPLLPHSQVR